MPKLTNWIVFVIALGLSFLSFGCAGSKFRTYSGPDVTRIEVHKDARKLYLFNNESILRVYNIDLGFSPVGAKRFEGDGKTPEGSYRISYKNPRSRYHLSIGVSYPDEKDVAYAESQGKKPGGDIMVHGYSGYRGKNKGDWTAGCIAVKNREIEEIYSMVQPGTPILIAP